MRVRDRVEGREHAGGGAVRRPSILGTQTRP